MENNLVQLLTKLSNEIVKNAYSDFDDTKQSRKKEQNFAKCCRKVCQKGFDVLLGKTGEPSVADPCVTDYGGNWDAKILILDYGVELERRGASKSNEELVHSMELLSEKPYAYIDELSKLLLLLKGPYSEHEHEQEYTFSFTGSDYFFKPTSMLSMVPKSISSFRSDGSSLSKKSSFHEEAAFYHVNWTSDVSSGFTLLDRFSKLSKESDKEDCIYVKEPEQDFLDDDIESDSIALSSTKKNVHLAGQKSSSQKHLFDIDNIHQLNSHSLLDHFVETPITHRLPNRTAQKKSKVEKGTSKPVQRTRANFKLLPDIASEKSSVWDYYEKEILSNNDVFDIDHSIGNRKSMLQTIEELSRCPNKDFSFQSVFNNHLTFLTCDSSIGYHERPLCRKTKEKDAYGSFFDSSKEIILSIWQRDCGLMQQLRPELTQDWPILRKIDLKTYVHNVKFLLTGISTQTFRYDKERKKFYMACGTCVEGVTPESLYEFSQEFMETGSCFVKLTQAALENGKYEPHNSRIICQAFWKGVHEFLEVHYASVLMIPDTSNLLALKAASRKLHDMITAVAEICKVSKIQISLPKGGQLITYLLRAAERLHKKYVQNVVFGILKICCDVYIKCLVQTWMFQGHLEHHINDFFVEHRLDKSKPKDRSYYLSFFMYSDRLPCFLNGLENSLFNCGKTVHLLKLFNPEDKFCQMLEKTNYPRMRFCQSDEELICLEAEFEEYAKRVYDFCGESVSVATLKNDEKIKEEEYERYIREMQVQLVENKRSERLILMEQKRAKKEVQRKMFKEQVEFAEMQKEKRRLEEEMENKRIEEEINKHTQKEMKMIEEEKIKMKKYYEELLNSVEKRQRRAEWRKKRLLLYDRRVSFLSNEEQPQEDDNFYNVINTSEDYQNDNEIATGEKDEQGNIVSTNPINKLDEENANVVEDATTYDRHKQLDNLQKGRVEYEKATDVDCERKAKLAKAQQNRLKIFGPDSNENEENELKRNKRKILSSEFGVTESDKKSQVLEETEAQRNKKKVLETEFNAIGKLDLQILNRRASGSETQDVAEETELQRNRRRVLQSEFGAVEMDKQPRNISEHNSNFVREETELERNRMKVLQSEFGVGEDHLASKNASRSETSIQSQETDLQRNKRKVLQSEIGLPLEPKVTSKSDTRNETDLQINRKKILGSEITETHQTEESNYENLTKMRKDGRLKLDLSKVDEEKADNTSDQSTGKLSGASSATSVATSTSCGSFVTATSNENGAEQNLADLEENVKSPGKNKAFLKVLELDTELFQEHRAYQNMFNSISKCAKRQDYSEFANTEFTEFQKCLHKSVSLPLKYQEKLANEALVKHFLVQENLPSHLNSLRCYFFLNDGEFGRSLTHNIFQMLSKCTEPHQFFERSVLKNIVNEALNYTIHNSEPNSQNLSFKIVEMPPFLNHSSHNVLAPFELSYHVKWPLNIILTEKALSKYKIIFQFLLKLKRISWTLNENFLHLTCWYKDKRVNGKVLINSPHYHKIQIYRHAMAQFIITLEDYVSSNGLQLSWINFLKDLETAENLDHLYQKHVRYIKDVLKRCFLTKQSQEMLKFIHNLIELGLKFHYTVKSSIWELVDGKYKHPKFAVLKATFNEFCALTRDFMKTLRKKISTNHELKTHFLLLEKFDMKLS